MVRGRRFTGSLTSVPHSQPVIAVEPLSDHAREASCPPQAMKMLVVFRWCLEKGPTFFVALRCAAPRGPVTVRSRSDPTADSVYKKVRNKMVRVLYLVIS